MFSHLTTMLLGRFTRQGDLLRVHLVYHYTCIEICLCLLLFSIAVTLTGSRGAGYVAAAILYIAAAQWPPLGPHPFPYFYFTLFPHLSSGLNPVRMTSPQMYSGLVVTYGALLGMLLASVRLYRRERALRLLLVVALLVAATARFRVHVFLPLLPGFLLVLALAWWRTRASACLVAAAVAVVSGMLLILETRSPVYLTGTAGLSFAYNGLGAEEWISAWPFGPSVLSLLRRQIHDPDTLRWTWQVVSLSAFVLWNMIGIPLLAATIAYLFGHRAFREDLWFTVLVLWLVVASTVTGMLVSMGYDTYSVGGQLLLHTRWYVFPFAATGVWSLYLLAQRCVSRFVLVGAGVVYAVACMVVQLMTPTGGALWAAKAAKTSFPHDEWQAFSVLHDQTPPDAVVISNKYVTQYKCVFSGLAGRAAYVEGGDNVVAEKVWRVNGRDDRERRVQKLWESTDSEEFCNLLATTKATHLVEFGGLPLHVKDPPCMRTMWVGPLKRVRIWKVVAR